MSWNLKLCLLLTASIFLWTSPATAQRYAGVQPQYERGNASAPEGALYLGGYSRDVGAGRVVVDFYTYRDPHETNDGVRFGALPIARRSVEAGDGQASVRWADGRVCGQLNGVLTEYARLTPPAFQAPPLYHAPPAGSAALGGPPARMHPGDSSVWGLARQPDGAPSVLAITGSDGLIDRWTEFAEAQLAECWIEEGPPGLP